jgi:hypothetical protein
MAQGSELFVSWGGGGWGGVRFCMLQTSPSEYLETKELAVAKILDAPYQLDLKRAQNLRK